MAILNIRYNGETKSYDNSNFNFNPLNYGKARLNIKVNSNIEKFGLTTNTNATEYCKLRIRIGNNIAYLGRVSTISYISGETPPYNKSTVTSSNFSVATQSEVQTALTSSNITIYTSSMSTATESISSSYTGTTGANIATHPTQPSIQTVTNATGSTVTTATALINTVLATRNAGNGVNTSPTNPGTPTVTNATGSTVTTATSLVGTKIVYWYSNTASATYTYNPINATGSNSTYSYSFTKTASVTGRYTRNAAANQGPGISAANPGMATWTNNTGITVVTRTQQWNSLTRVDTWYSKSQSRHMLYWTNQNLLTRQFPAVGANKALTSRHTFYQTYSQNNQTTRTAAQVYNNVATAGWGAAQTTTNTGNAYQSSYASTTRRISNTTLKASKDQGGQETGQKTIVNNSSNFQKSELHSYTRTSSISASIKSTTSTKYLTKETKWHSEYQVGAAQAIQTYYSSYYAARWSYWWNSSSYYTLSTYTGTYNRSFSSIASTWNASWTSCSKYTNSTYNASWTSCSKASSTTYKTSKTSSTTSVTETVHNMNI